MTLSMNPNSNDIHDISVMEDLEPDTGSKQSSTDASKNRVREAALGLLLLLGVLAWAGWLWRQTDAKQSSYAAAVQAEAAKDCDSVERQYTAASGYKDADTQAARVAKIIADRDRHYQSATNAVSSRQWIGALNEIHEVERIQPAYKEVSDLNLQATEGAYRDSLQGTIALRSSQRAQPPGLYYRGAAGWIWLEGSDPGLV